MAKKTEQIQIGRRRVSLSNLDKVLYPGKRFTKARVIDYYISISKYLLPHLKNRPVTLKRFPEGVFGEFFYEKDAPAFTPDWVKTFPVPRRETAGPDIRYILINDVATLVWVANLASLEIHPFLHRVPNIGRPTSMVLDCDPGEGADILSCARVALMLHDILRELSLESLVKVSGSKGLQVYVPLNSKVTYDETGALAKALADLLHEREPKLIVSSMSKQVRTKKVFIDWSQNSEFKTTVGVYSLRAKIYRPYVSLPVTWNELNDALENRNKELLYFTPEEAIARVEADGDLFKPLLKKVQQLPREFRSHLQRRNKTSAISKNALQTYSAKRNFEKTKEPKPTLKQRSRQGSRRRFVIQKHAASQLHYDFRLEMHGVLKSWSVPKGPPVKLDERRLAMPTEDHPIDYLKFEGIIPKGEYGGGTVMVWDIGTYDLIEGNYYQGFLRIYLSGVKLKGEWTLERFASDRNGKDKRDQWRLVKSNRNTRSVSKERDDQSALSRRSMAEIAKASDATWRSNRVRSTTRLSL
ncbi:MAG: hypothetical protein DMF69_04705 [Acidobacteria bacterium]|nr:MAG: hypothetical protein DMF69_04705 [Acidobacteriota bacterium]